MATPALAKDFKEFLKSLNSNITSTVFPREKIESFRRHLVRVLASCLMAFEDWPSLSVAQIKRLIDFAHTHREQPNP